MKVKVLVVILVVEIVHMFDLYLDPYKLLECISRFLQHPTVLYNAIPL